MQGPVHMGSQVQSPTHVSRTQNGDKVPTFELKNPYFMVYIHLRCILIILCKKFAQLMLRVGSSCLLGATLNTSTSLTFKNCYTWDRMWTGLKIQIEFAAFEHHSGIMQYWILMNYGAQKKGQKKLEDGLKNVTYATFLHVVHIRMRHWEMLALLPWPSTEGLKAKFPFPKQEFLHMRETLMLRTTSIIKVENVLEKQKMSEPILWTATCASILKALIKYAAYMCFYI